MERKGLALLERGSSYDHRHSLVGSRLLRPQATQGEGRMKKLRCAIYTGKSSEEGLEQDFN